MRGQLWSTSIWYQGSNYRKVGVVKRTESCGRLSKQSASHQHGLFFFFFFKEKHNLFNVAHLPSRCVQYVSRDTAITQFIFLAHSLMVFGCCASAHVALSLTQTMTWYALIRKTGLCNGSSRVHHEKKKVASLYCETSSDQGKDEFHCCRIYRAAECIFHTKSQSLSSSPYCTRQMKILPTVRGGDFANWMWKSQLWVQLWSLDWYRCVGCVQGGDSKSPPPLL